MIKFNSSSEPTIGVEIELQLIDKNNLNLNNISSKVLTDVNKEFSDNIKCELIESMIEINTNICSNIEEVEKDIRKTLNHLDKILKNHETEINCTSLHPFAIGKNQIITDTPRYKRIMKDLQMVGKHFISQGLHVHIGINNPENYSTVRDIALMSKYLISNYPKFYEWYKEKTFTWDRTGGDPITQGNRNPLLYKKIGVDGIKTGYLAVEKYSLASSMKKDTRRVIAVGSGFPKKNLRS